MSLIEDWSSKRKITFKKKSHRGIFPTQKSSNTFVEFESTVERDFFIECDHDPDVIIFQHQPHTIEFINSKGNKKRYTPDAKIKFRSAEKYILAEIKRKADIEKNIEEYREKFLAAQKFAEDNGMIFVIITDEMIRTPRFYNIWFTKGSSRVFENDEYYHILDDILYPNSGMQYNEVCIKLGQRIGASLTKASQIVSYFIYHGDIYVPTFSKLKLSGETNLFRKNTSKTVFLSLFKDLKLSDITYINRSNYDTISIKEVTDNKKPDINDEKEIDLQFYDISPKYEKIVLNRLNIVEAWIQNVAQKKRKPIEIRKELDEKFLYKWNKVWTDLYAKNVPIGSVKRWVTNYKRDGIYGLVPKHENKGRKKQYSKESLDVFDEARVNYLRYKSKKTLEKAYKDYLKLCQEYELASFDILKKDTFIRYIYRLSNKSELDRGVLSYSNYDTLYDPTYQVFPNAIMPLQIIQMDNSQFDQFIVDEDLREVIHPPWLTACIDVYTMMITGYYLHLEHPSFTAVIETMIQTILPKNEICKNYEIDHDQWKIEGYPVLLLIDNGKDYVANSIIQFALDNNIIIEYARLGKGKDKPHIEQWFRRVWDAVKNEEAGGYRPPFLQRIKNRDYDPEADATLTFMELEKWFISWILETYHEKPRMKNMKASPRVKYKKAIEGKTKIILPEAMTPPDLITLKGKFDYRTKMKKYTYLKSEYKLHNSGIERLSLRYNSIQLQMLYKKIGSKGPKVTTYIDRRDIRKIIIEVEDQYIEAFVYGNIWEEIQETILQLRGIPISNGQWKTLRKIMMVQNTKEINVNLLKNAYTKREELIEKARNNVKSAKKKTKKYRTELEKSNITNRKSVVKTNNNDDEYSNKEIEEEIDLDLPEETLDIGNENEILEIENINIDEDTENEDILPLPDEVLDVGERN